MPADDGINAASEPPKMRRQVKIAILMADAVAPSIKDIYDDMYVWFSQLFKTAAAHYFPLVEVQTTKWDVFTSCELPPDPLAFDALLITGSKSGVYDLPNSPWMQELDAYIRKCYEAKARQIGVCFGHQLIAHSLGGKVELSPKGWEIGKVEIELSDEALAILGTKRKIVPLLASHKDHVLEAPPNVAILGSTPLCAIHGLYQPSLIFTTQGHPEVHPDVLSEIVRLRWEQGVFSDEQREQILAGIHSPKLDFWYGAKMLAFAMGLDMGVVPDPHEAADYDV